MATRIREKARLAAENKDVRPRAKARYIRMSSSKIAIVLDLIRGKGFFDALAILQNNTNKASRPVLKALNSAGANAENNLNISKDDLYVAEVYATQGPSFKRARKAGRKPRRMPMDIITRRTAHITVILDSIKEKK